MTTDKNQSHTQKTIKEIIAQGSRGKPENEKWKEYVLKNDKPTDKPAAASQSLSKEQALDKQTPDINQEK